MRGGRGSVGIVPLIALLIPSVVLANVGTPLMWSGVFRLFPINCLIGVGEGLIIWLVFRTGFFRTIGILLLANYAAWIAGDIVLLPLLAKAGKGFLGEQPLYHVWEFMRYVLVAAFGLSVLLEWPFCLWAMKQKRYRIIKAVVAVIAVNLVSYVFLVNFYLGMSSATVLTKLTQDPTLSFAVNPKAWVYYISSSGEDLCRIRTNGAEIQRLLRFSEVLPKKFILPTKKEFDVPFNTVGLFLYPSDKKEYWDLFYWINDTEEEEISLLPAFAKQESPLRYLPQNMKYGVDERSPGPYERPQLCEYLISTRQEILVGVWPLEGLIIQQGEKEKHFALELPFLKWYSRSPTFLPGNQVVYQLGDQIVLLDLEKDLIGVVARGYSPVVVLDEEAGGEGQATGNL